MCMPRATMRPRCFRCWSRVAPRLCPRPTTATGRTWPWLLTGKMDAHFTALWDHGHIKFWSIKTLGELLREAGFTDIRFERVGRMPSAGQVDDCHCAQTMKLCRRHPDAQRRAAPERAASPVWLASPAQSSLRTVFRPTPRWRSPASMACG
jgi:hypothetical protein